MSEHENRRTVQKRKLCWLRWTCSHIGSAIPWGCPGDKSSGWPSPPRLHRKRPLIVFDEPTSGLDLFHMRQVAEVVNRVAEHGRTVVVVTHDPEFILRCCNLLSTWSTARFRKVTPSVSRRVENICWNFS